jgi:hypothetical protein
MTFKVNDRVRRKKFSITLPKEGELYDYEPDNDTPTMTVTSSGCPGVVKAVRYETSTSSSDRTGEKSVMLHIQWDNGTLSYLGPEGVERI